MNLTIRVDNGGDVEVELVDNSLDSGVAAVLGQELVGHVLGSLHKWLVTIAIILTLR